MGNGIIHYFKQCQHKKSIKKPDHFCKWSGVKAITIVIYPYVLAIQQ